MQDFFLTLGFKELSLKYREFITTFLALVLAIFILVFFDSKTLFLATTLMSVLAIKMINNYINATKDTKNILINKVIGLCVALSVSPAIGVPLNEVFRLNNGFLAQSSVSFLLFIYFYTKKPSIIGRLNHAKKSGITIIASDIIAGFAAGVSSSILWQFIHTYL